MRHPLFLQAYDLYGFVLEESKALRGTPHGTIYAPISFKPYACQTFDKHLACAKGYIEDE